MQSRENDKKILNFIVFGQIKNNGVGIVFRFFYILGQVRLGFIGHCVAPQVKGTAVIGHAGLGLPVGKK